LEVMVENKPDFLFVQTRSPLVRRDIDLFLPLKDRVRVSMTIETDREDIRKHFTSGAPPISESYRVYRYEGALNDLNEGVVQKSLD
jgi:DNA repair photolyase